MRRWVKNALILLMLLAGFPLLLALMGVVVKYELRYVDWLGR